MWDPWPDVAIHVEWGERGAHEAAARGDDVVVADAFSFCTTVTLAVGRGARVLALGRGEHPPPDTHPPAHDRTDPDARLTLSPGSAERVQPGDRVALASPNGAAAVAACRAAPRVTLACFRNRTAAARAIRTDRRTTVVACAERWSSIGAGHGVRPSLEDWLAAGAVVATVDQTVSRSPEADAAAATFAAATRPDAPGRLEAWLRGSVSGRELVAKGFASDVDLLVALDTTPVVPVLAPDGFFEADGRTVSRRG